jgi:hypothetical protein
VGNYGKLRIGTVKLPSLYALKFEITVYKSDGTLLIPNSEVLLPAQDGFDLDTSKEIFNDTSDFLWALPEEDNTYSIAPLNGAKFYVYAQ